VTNVAFDVTNVTFWPPTVLTHSLTRRPRSCETPNLVGYVAVTQRIFEVSNCSVPNRCSTKHRTSGQPIVQSKGGVGKFCREREAAVNERRQALDAAMRSVKEVTDPQTDAAIRIVAWATHGALKPTDDDFAMLRLVLLALLPADRGHPAHGRSINEMKRRDFSFAEGRQDPLAARLVAHGAIAR
jgi:hypothetical protein